MDTKVYKNENGTLCQLSIEKSDHRNFLHYILAHPKTEKDSIPYSQALHIKQICSKTSEVIKHLEKSDHRNFLHYKLAHPKTVKDSIPYSQALHLKQICSETSEVINHLKHL